MRLTILFLGVAITFSSVVFSQSYSSSVEVVTVYSQNELFYLRSWPFDNESPSLRGHTKVYRKGVSEPIYSFDRGFDAVDDDSNNLALSNDGSVIFYLIPWGANEETVGLKSISIYKGGKIVQSYSASEITGCDLQKERCDLKYSNWEQVVDEERSNLGTSAFKKVLKDGVSEEERFLSDFPLFSFDDTVYLVDSKKVVHQFDLKEVKFRTSDPISNAFATLKTKGRLTKVKLERYDAPTYLDFPKIVSGETSEVALATALRMKPTKNYGADSDRYRSYRLMVSGYLSRNGRFEVVELDNSEKLPEDPIRAFFATNRFDATSIPTAIEKWWIEEYFYFRNANNRLAIAERKVQLNEQSIAVKKRLVAEEIDGRYIPKDLGETFLELDKVLSEINRKEMSALVNRKDMIQYHLGLGMWIRNNWGLWGGSRLQKYFTDKGMTHPDDMSSVILFYYWDWLKGNKDKWKEWERDPKQKLF